MQYVLVSVYVISMQRVELCIIIIILIEGYSHLTRTRPDQLHVIYMHLLIFVYVCPHFLMFLKVHVQLYIYTYNGNPQSFIIVFVVCNVSNYSDTCLN